MWKTALLLLFTFIVVPIVAFNFDVAPSDQQWAVLKTSGTIYLVFAALCFLISSATDNYSQVDKLWSIMPIVYGWVAYAYAPDTRILLMALLITLWGVRLTYNFSRRGGYSWRFWTGEEDYRWAILRAKPEFQAPWKWFLFNFFFISFYQMGLIWLMTVPIIKAAGGGPASGWDYLLFALGIGFVLFETIADQQQWNFQNEKHRRKKEGTPAGTRYEKGFIHDGLWGLVRHPNYFAEQAVWVVVYLFSVSATGTWINWSIAGILLLIVLFKGSSDFSEEITASKYPAYTEYRKRVPRYFPLFGIGKNKHIPAPAVESLDPEGKE